MPPAYEVGYRPEVETEDLLAIPCNLQLRIFRAVESRLMVEPARYGVRLRRSLAGLWKLRVGDYRVVYEIRGRLVTVRAICHRKDVYGEVESRWTR